MLTVSESHPFHPQAEPAPAHQQDLVWREACKVEQIIPGTGVAALFFGQQIAIIRTAEGQLFALSNFDPFSKAFVISRGIVGDRGGVPKIASPIFKQNFDLRTGACLDDPSVRLRVYPLRVAAGRIEIGFRPDEVG